jgi:hypothetical protein
MSSAAFRRLASMDRKQAAFRVRREARKLLERASVAMSPPRWNRHQLALVMQDASQESEWTRARSAVGRGDFQAAQIALGRYFAQRRSRFPVDPAGIRNRAAAIIRTFPNAAADAIERADAVTRGEYDLLGYRRICVGAIDWHADPVSGGRAPLAHWTSVRYLDPTHGDHKVIWEFNRHQHWLALGRAYALTGSSKYYGVFRGQLDDWMRSNPPGMGINWASMLELGFRTISWLWAIGFFSPATLDDDVSGQPWLVDALLAINRQLQHVERNLSVYFSPNTHLTGEALALYVAGCALPELTSSARWAALGRDVLLQQARAQVLADGGHAELSGHYHRYSTDFYLLALTAARAAGDPAAAAFEQAARRQARYLRTITDDEGRRPSTGDDDGGQLFPICGRRSDDCADTLAIAGILLGEPDLAISATPEEAFWWCGDDAARLSAPPPNAFRRSIALRESGYCVSRNSRGDYLLFDAGPHGFLNAGHAHSDALSIVLTVARRPLLVDPGTATYTMDPELRDRFRSTAMHNTLVLDHQPQSVPAGPFHWKRAANARLRVWRATPSGSPQGADYMEGTHDGYAPRRHIRSVLAIDEVGWWIIDTVMGEGTADVATHWHLHPAWHVNGGEGHVVLRHADGTTLALATSGHVELAGPGESPLACWSPEYGRVEPASTIAVHNRGELPLTLAAFIPADASLTRRLSVRRMTVNNAPPRWLGSGWQAAWDGGEVSLAIAVNESGTARDPWSPTVWGADELTTDARVASSVRIRGRECVVVIDGSLAMAARTPLIAAQLPVEIVRQPLANMARLVHQHDGAGARVQ